MKKREAIKEAIEAWAAAKNPEIITRLGSNDATADELRVELADKIAAALKIRKTKNK